MDILTSKLTPSDQAIESSVGDETVLLNLENGTYYGLDPVGTRIWALLKQEHSPAEICDLLSAEYEVEQVTIENDVRSFLTDLKTHGIVIEG
ncbi:PqqD family protein [Pseudomonas sp. N040]|uniref:PqqD family protein n=1 Tax=Pseudomonas sp. N040 TaxID=2785325 RepID=UPI0018A3335E|nr:PqqD family protein [Pseudomonas sp. N040]MBF7728670.1 PqqD family protein [Pseudomonas sp. N040]MBW7012310.1 PqqD family protein [Pseudomonas sp. N040]